MAENYIDRGATYTFYVILVILITAILIPGILVWLGYIDDTVWVVKSPSYYTESMAYIGCFLALFVLVFYVERSRIRRKLSCSFKYNLKRRGKSVKYGNKGFVFSVSLLIAAWLLLLYSVPLDDLVNPKYRFDSPAPILNNISQAFFLLVFGLQVIRPKRKFLHHGLLWLSLIGFLSYQISNSSRAVAVPFVFLSLYFFFIKNEIFKTIFFGYVSVLMLGAALATRSELGFLNFYNNIIMLIENPLYIYLFAIMVSPGISTASSAFEMREIGSGNHDGIIGFIAYISPVPSFILPDSMLGGVGFSEYLGANIGLNSDFISEWVIRFGFFGFIFAALFVNVIILTPLYLSTLRNVGIKYSFIFNFSAIYFIAAGMSMNLRASSRFYVYVLMSYLIYYYVFPFFRKGKEGAKNIKPLSSNQPTERGVTELGKVQN